MLGDEAKLAFPSMVWIAVMPNKRRSEKIYSRYRLGNDVGVLKYFASYLPRVQKRLAKSTCLLCAASCKGVDLYLISALGSAPIIYKKEIE